MIITLGAEKGGVGKTTLAVNLAAQRTLEGHDVLLVDTDLQISASFWSQRRDEAGLQPRVACMQKFGKGLQGTRRQKSVGGLSAAHAMISADSTAGAGRDDGRRSHLTSRLATHATRIRQGQQRSGGPPEAKKGEG